MRKILIAGTIGAALIVATTAASAGERTLTGAAIGAGAGAIVAGPIGAVYDRRGHRHCRWR
jgi:hypothetical protein